MHLCLKGTASVISSNYPTPCQDDNERLTRPLKNCSDQFCEKFCRYALVLINQAFLINININTLLHKRLDKAFLGTVVHRALPSLHVEGNLK